MTATIPEGQELYRWVDSVTGKVYKGNPLTIAVTEPLNLEPVFGTLYHVDTNGSDDTTTGTSRETAFKTIGKALAKCVGGDSIKVWASATPYEVTDVLTLDKGVSVFGSTDNPADTVIKRKSGDNGIFSLNHADAEVRNLTIADGYRGHSKGGAGGVNIWANGGTLYHCIVRGCSDGNYANGGGIYIADNSPALVDRCVVSNCTTYISAGSDNCGGSAIQLRSGTVRNTLCVLNDMVGDAAQGGTIRMMGGVLENCTIAGNWGAVCPGIRVTGSTALIRNCIVSSNATDSATASDRVFSGTSTACITKSVMDVDIGAASALVEAPEVTFRRPARGDWRLRKGTAALDYGTYAVWMDGATDLRGNQRLLGKRPDAGCYERFDGGFTVIVR